MNLLCDILIILIILTRVSLFYHKGEIMTKKEKYMELFGATKELFEVSSRVYLDRAYPRHERRAAFSVMERCCNAQRYLNRRAVKYLGQSIARF